jgi:hypothetical protein
MIRRRARLFERKVSIAVGDYSPILQRRVESTGVERVARCWLAMVPESVRISLSQRLVGADGP